MSLCLDRLKIEYPDVQFVVSSSLNEGVERGLVNLALTTLNAELNVILPLPYELHQQHIRGYAHLSRDDSFEEFERMVGLSSYYFEMPLRFLESLQQGNSNYAARQRALAGAYLCQRSDQLITLTGDARGVDSVWQLCCWSREGFPPEMNFPGDLYPLRTPATLIACGTVPTAEPVFNAEIS